MVKTIGTIPPSLHTATVAWECGQQIFVDGRYSRRHSWHFDGGATVAAAASPHVVRVPYTDPAAVDPEEALLAAIAACHMLTFLHLASKRGFRAESYRDEVIGKLDKNSVGKFAITAVVLHPKIEFVGEPMPTAADIDDLHHAAHAECFIANSVNCGITWE